MTRQKAEWQRKFEAQVRKVTGDFQAWMAGGDLWYTCGCGAHWLTPLCGVDCLLTHQQDPDWNLCNWPPEMLKYWEWRNWREWTPPVDYPDIRHIRPAQSMAMIVHWRDPVTGKRDPDMVGIYLRAPVVEHIVFAPGDIGHLTVWLTEQEINEMILEFRWRKLRNY